MPGITPRSGIAWLFEYIFLCLRMPTSVEELKEFSFITTKLSTVSIKMPRSQRIAFSRIPFSKSKKSSSQSEYREREGSNRIKQFFNQSHALLNRTHWLYLCRVVSTDPEPFFPSHLGQREEGYFPGISLFPRSLVPTLSWSKRNKELLASELKTPLSSLLHFSGQSLPGYLSSTTGAGNSSKWQLYRSLVVIS